MLIKSKIILAVSLLILTFLFSSCSHVVYPRGPIPVEMDTVGPIVSSNEISLVNAVRESKQTLVATKGSDKFFADYHKWTEFIVGQLQTELEKRNVKVKPESNNVFEITVPSLRFFWGSWAVRCIVNVQVARGDGTWGKTYEGNNAGYTIERAIDGAVHKAIVEILRDESFRSAISKEYTIKSEPISEEEMIKQLKQLKEMREKGLITEEEYQNKKKEILEKF
jgi:hypothetical protein